MTAFKIMWRCWWDLNKYFVDYQTQMKWKGEITLKMEKIKQKNKYSFFSNVIVYKSIRWQ